MRHRRGRTRGDLTRAATVTSARVSHTQWFFVNLYEAVVRMPDRLAEEHDAASRPATRGPLGWGSPARYHIPAAPITVLSALGTAAIAARRRERRGAATVAAASSLLGTALSGYIVRTVNLRLLDDGPPLAEVERRHLVARWHALNRARLALVGLAAVGFEYASRDRPPSASYTGRFDTDPVGTGEEMAHLPGRS